jgi:Protein phosphatase 2C
MTRTDHPAEDRIATWHVITGSARGAGHTVSGLPNQDAVARQDGPGGAIAVAIADGHGHVRHFRSADGSALAVDVACQVASRIAARLTAGAPGAEEAALAGQELAEVLVADWRSAVAAQLAVRPYTAQEDSVLNLAADPPEVPYGSTLLVATIAADWLVCAQIGDGDMLAVCPDGRFFYPVAGDDRLDGQRTTSMCQADAVGSFRTAAHDLREVPLVALLLATDGYGNAQADEPWQPGVGRDLAALAAEHDHHWFEQQVPDWAQRCASTEGSGDDTTIALLLHPGGDPRTGRVQAAAERGSPEWTD